MNELYEILNELKDVWCLIAMTLRFSNQIVNLEVTNSPKMRSLLKITLACFLFVGCREEFKNSNARIIGTGQMPGVARDNEGRIHIVYGDKESIMYSVSSDQGKSFSTPVTISSLPNLAASHMRGPQIATTSIGLVVTACTEEGDIYSIVKENSGDWMKSTRINDADTVAKENLMALSADGNTTFAVWQDMRNGQNKIYGARSIDGGKSWEKNIMIYGSPDGSVCECCKPSVVVKGNQVYVMFRNWIDGNRDMYVVKSEDGGNTFEQAQKIGSGSWQLKGCPMDGGNLTLNNNGNIETVWRRKSKIYSAEPGKEEQEIGEGKSCTLESVNGKNVFAWVEDGNVIVLKPMQNMKKNLGNGSMPVLKAINNEHVICVWENEEKIYADVVEL